MRRILLATTAAAALVAGSSLTMAQVSGGANVGAGGGGNAGVQQHSQGSAGVNAHGNASTQGNAGARGMTQNGRGEQRGHAYGEERNERMGQRSQRNERFGERDRGVREGRGTVRGGTTRLSSDQRTTIHERLFAEGGRGHRLGHVDFALREGVRIPHGTHLYPLPEDIVTLVPAYRDYEYILVGDNIVIVDPDTYEIVAVIPA